MAVIITTDEPEDLIEAFDLLIEEGKIRTWVEEGDGGGYTHKARQYAGKARVYFEETDPGVQALILFPRDQPFNRGIYAIYASDIVQAMITHLYRYIQSLRVTMNRTKLERERQDEV